MEAKVTKEELEAFLQFSSTPGITREEALAAAREYFKDRAYTDQAREALSLEGELQLETDLEAYSKKLAEAQAQAAANLQL